MTFRAHEGLLVLTGKPWWQCWRYTAVGEAILAQQADDFMSAYRRALDGSQMPIDVYAAFTSGLMSEEIAEQLQVLEMRFLLLEPDDAAGQRELEDEFMEMIRGAMRSFVNALAVVRRRAPNAASDVLPEGFLELAAAQDPDMDERLTDYIFAQLEAIADDPAFNRAMEAAGTEVGEKLELATVNLEEEMLASLDETHETNPTVEVLQPYSDELTRQIEEANGINPTVYHNLITTMRFAALFRHVKANNPANYRRFLQSLDDISIDLVSPQDYELETPGFLPRGAAQ